MTTTLNFNLEKARSGAALTTRAGYAVTVFSFCRRSTAYPIVGIIHLPAYDFVGTWTPEGKATRLDKPHDNDLMLCEKAPQTTTQKLF